MASDTQIPTDYRVRLPKGMSYPLGAKQVSTALAGVPQYSELTVAFSDSSTLMASDFKRLLASGKCFRIVEASYLNMPAGISTSHALIAAGCYSPTWRIHVYAVPSQHRHGVQTILLERGLGLIAQWFKEPRHPTWLDTSKSFALGVKLEEPALFQREDNGAWRSVA